MPATEFKLGDDFPPVSYEQWRALAEADLDGASFDEKRVTHADDGIDVQPLYTRRDEIGPGDPFGFPGSPPYVRGAEALGAVQYGWDLRQEYRLSDLTAANRAILEDLAGGVTSISLRLNPATHSGIDSDGVNDLDTALAGVRLDEVGVALEAGAAFMPMATALIALWKRRGVTSEKAKGAFNADPLSAFAADIGSSQSRAPAIDELANLARLTWQKYPGVTAVGVDTTAYHDAGATAAQEIACALATGVEYLRAMTAAGLDVNAAAKQILFHFHLGTHHFLEICKLRAARLTWSRVIEHCGGTTDSGAMRIHARVSKRVLTRDDPHMNLLRNTAAVFAACLGGAEAITPAPFDSALGPPSGFSRRIARNTLLILQEEAHLNRVINPAGGSWYLDRLTQQLAEKAWAVFQQIEGRGGMATALASGWIAAEIDETRSSQRTK